MYEALSGAVSRRPSGGKAEQGVWLGFELLKIFTECRHFNPYLVHLLEVGYQQKENQEAPCPTLQRI